MSERFYTFPLAALAMPIPEPEIITHLVSVAIHRAGSGERADEMGSDEVLEAVIRNATKGYNQSEAHKRIVRGMVILGFSKGYLPDELARCDAVDKFVRGIEAKHGASPLVFISSEMFNLYPSSLNFREFSTLCGINSIIGVQRSRLPVIIRRSLIQARQMGYKSPAVMRDELAAANRTKHTRTDRQPLSVQQLRGVLDCLEMRSLITRCQPKPRSRTVYFSTGLDPSELRDAVKRITDCKRTVKQNRLADWKFFSNQSGASREPVNNQ